MIYINRFLGNLFLTIDAGSFLVSIVSDPYWLLYNIFVNRFLGSEFFFIDVMEFFVTTGSLPMLTLEQHLLELLIMVERNPTTKL